MTADVDAIVGLLVQADWTRLCLSAELTTVHDESVQSGLRSSVAVRAWRARRDRPDPAAWQAAAAAEPKADLRTSRSRLLIAPGSRYRQEFDVTGLVLGSDGQTAWHLDDDQIDCPDPHSAASWPPAEELLCPAWLPSLFELEIAGADVMAGRQVLRITARPRPLLRGRSGPGRSGMPRVLPASWRKSGQDVLDRIDEFWMPSSASCCVVYGCSTGSSSAAASSPRS